MKETKKKIYQFNVRMDEAQHNRLEAVAEHIAKESRGQKPEFAEIIRSLIGWSNPDLVTRTERDYLAGLIDSLPPADSQAGPYRDATVPPSPEHVRIVPVKRKSIRKQR